MKLGDMCRIEMGQSPQGNTCNIYGNGIPLLNGPTEFGSTHPLPAQWTTDPKKLAEAGDILFCVRGSTTGRMNWADRQYAIGRGIASIQHKTPELNYFAWSIIKWKLDELLAIATGSTFPNVSKEMLNSLEIPNFTTHEQRKIVEILAPLDEKIVNNTKINHHLEQMAQAIFKSWFVDYEPFVGNDFIESELGKIPVGWHVGNIGDIVCLQRGHDLPISATVEGKYPVIGSKGIIAFHNEFTSEAPVIILGRSGNIGLPRYYNRDCWAHNTSIYSKKIFAAPLWVYFTLCQIDYSVFRGGSAVPTLNRNHVESWSIAIPPAEIQNDFHAAIEPLFFKLDVLEEESKHLAAIRDTLLPKLMSGELSVADLTAK